jgi:ribosome-binding protein aMBF1 (putative translation factor)
MARSVTMDEKNICTKFGNNIKKYRLKKGFSQEELAELSNLHRTYISAVERGCTIPLKLDKLK